VNYVFPTFVITKLPVGLVGLLIAAIFAAAMSTIAAELNARAGAFWGMVAGMAAVVVVGLNAPVSYLWLNVVGAVVLVSVGMATSV
jgi:Na+/proline symporter